MTLQVRLPYNRITFAKRVCKVARLSHRGGTGTHGAETGSDNQNQTASTMDEETARRLLVGLTEVSEAGVLRWHQVVAANTNNLECVFSSIATNPHGVTKPTLDVLMHARP